MVFVPVPGTEFLDPSEFPSEKGTGSIFCSNERLWVAPGLGLVTKKTQPWLHAWDFQPCPLFSSQGGTGNGSLR